MYGGLCVLGVGLVYFGLCFWLCWGFLLVVWGWFFVCLGFFGGVLVGLGS